MKATIRIKTIGYDESVKMEVRLTKPTGYSRDSLRSWKQKLENKLHAVLVEDGYPASAIRFTK
jgi:hypothetical protein